MKTIARRLRKLEEGLGLLPETEEDRRLWERLEAGRRRMAEARGSGEYDEGPVPQDQARGRDRSDRRSFSDKTIVEILNQGRERARARAAADA
jgi:hypothetical protein